mmetsp:Transcript_14101/g.21396  ORF Transcript_14101/g.21396 Transcript_14101/m.21396 type:complete len:1851 (+) Transcript_14101:177-5729(+)|eukprot:CAMPEP_0167762906 /NCGR_PEP_ID=MMETSP0110_2-20121227/13045_1 /TAXON_ID=629695 /ORGANISM="Gymnochlora sp., Strain CCMP2014" /LENGTH=1850 /DNA_ID=CAMNT_0007649867 /DNA_START=114 /DNA_END=5666 /DNA_ORIENTATION=+
MQSEGLVALKHDWKWMPHDSLVWVPGTILKNEKTDKFMMRTKDGEEIPIQDFKKIQKKNSSLQDGTVRLFHVSAKGKVFPFKFNGSESKWEEAAPSQPVFHQTLKGNYANLGEMEDMSEAPCNHQLRKRYMTDDIYTWMGSILVAINPYKLLPIYSYEHISAYSNNKRAQKSRENPHIFSVASGAYDNLLRKGMSQAVIISGESGAGKTESTKLILQFLGEMSRQAGRGENGTGVEQEMLLSNPILEAFGNAKTIQNDNSSRFGKWMEVGFAKNGTVSNASIRVYLLERSRVVAQNAGEKNYHVFYMLPKGASEEWREELKLKKEENFVYAKTEPESEKDIKNASDEKKGHHQDHKAEFEALVDRMEHLGFSKTNISDVFHVVAAVLHLGNLSFKVKDSEGKFMEETEIEDKSRMQTICNFLGLNQELFEKSLLYREVSVRNDSTFTPLKLEEVKTVRDAASKFIYSRLFRYLVEQINSRLRTRKECTSIGVLDIFGFEVFQKNSFEQFCINYANEKLQYLFNQHVFLGELREYKSQGIDVTGVSFTNNKGCLDMIENKKLGLIAMMTEEAALPQGSEKGLVAKMHLKFKKNEYYKHIKKAPMSFVISHYAGKVRYEIENFLQKDNDFLSADIIKALDATDKKMVRKLVRMQAFEPQRSTSDLFKGKKGRTRKSSSVMTRKQMTVSARFRKHLSSLMQKLQQSEPHYVRCLKPNGEKKSNVYDSVIVLRQIKYAGLLQAIKLRKMGYPYRQSHDEFIRQYSICDKKYARSMRRKHKRARSLSENPFTSVSPKSDSKRQHRRTRTASSIATNNISPRGSRLSFFAKNIGKLSDTKDKKDDNKAVLILVDTEEERKKKEAAKKKEEEVKKESCVSLFNTIWESLVAENGADSKLSQDDYRIGKTKVFMKDSVRNALTKLWQKAIQSRLLLVQSIVRMWIDRKRFRQLLLIYRRGKFAAMTRDLKQLNLVFADIEEQEFEEVNPHFVRTLRKLKSFLEAQSHVLFVIHQACDSRDLQLLQASKGNVDQFLLEYPKEKPSEELIKAKGKAMSIIAHLEELIRVKELLKTALLHEDIRELEVALKISSEHHELKSNSTVAEAKNLLVKLQKQEAVRTVFQECFSKMSKQKIMTFEEICDLENKTDKVKLLNSDSKRDAKVVAADKLMMSALEQLIEKAQDAADWKVLEEKLIPKAGAMGYLKLENASLAWLEDEREKEQLRIEREKEEKERIERERIEAEVKAKAEAEAAAKALEEKEKKSASSMTQQGDEETEKAKTTEVKEEEKVETKATTASKKEEQKVEESAPEVSEKPKTEVAGEVIEKEEERSSPTVFQAGAIVTIVGLKVNSEYNEMIGTVEGFDHDHQRFVVQLGEGGTERLGVLGENIRLVQSARLRVLKRKKDLESSKQQETAKTLNEFGLDGIGPGNGDLSQEIRNEIRKAVKDGDRFALKELLNKPEVKAATSHRDVRVATKVLHSLDDAAEAGTMLQDAINAVKTTAIKTWLHKISEMDTGVQQRLQQLVERGRHIAYLMTKEEILVLKLRKALQDLNKSKLRFLLKHAHTPWLRAQPEVMRAESFLAANPDGASPATASLKSSPATSKPRTPRRKPTDQDQKSKSPMVHQLRTALKDFKNIRGMYPLGSLACLRTEKQYLKKIFFHRKYYRSHRLIHQSEPLPHSVTYLKTASHDVKQKAKHMFRNVLYYTEEVYHAYPVTVGYEVLQQAIQEPQLRPEIFCQLVKQTTDCKSRQTLLRHWKLLFLCLHAFVPIGEVERCVLSHAAKYANFHVDLSVRKDRMKLKILDSVETIATLILLLQFQRLITPCSPTMAEVEAVTDGILPESLEPPVLKVFKKNET